MHTLGHSFSVPSHKSFTIGTTPVRITAGKPGRLFFLMSIPASNTGKIYIHLGPYNPNGINGSTSDVITNSGIELSNSMPMYEISSKNRFYGHIWAIADAPGQILNCTSDYKEI